MDKIYELRYLPLFYDDVNEKIQYIANVLKNPQAANDLLDEVEEAILTRIDNPESFEKYKSNRERKYPYYRIYVKNYVIYYVVIHEDQRSVMEVRRFLYKGQDRDYIV